LFRSGNAILSAKQAATIDNLTDGRLLVLGVGLAWNQAEYGYVGAKWKQRGRIMDESLQVMRNLWTDDRPHAGGPSDCSTRDWGRREHSWHGAMAHSDRIRRQLMTMNVAVAGHSCATSDRSLTPLQLLDPSGRLLAPAPPLDDEQAVCGLRAMVLGRRFDERCVNLQRRGLMVTLAPGIGQEACSVGSVLSLDCTQDWFVPQYREVAGQLFHGLPLKQAFLWHMGSPLGFHIGPGMRMLPFQAAVAGQIPHAVGLAWGLALQKKPGVVVVHFGEGATSQGDFHEAANLAGVMKAPVIFICQNNYWAISTAATLQTAAPTFAHKALAYGFPGVQVDGNDLFAVYRATADAVERARSGEGPTLIEALTYRLGMHTTADDGSRCEPAGMRDAWRPKDPLIRLQLYLSQRNMWNDAIAARMEDEVTADLDRAWQAAQAEAPPRLEDSLSHVFAEMTPRLREQVGWHAEVE
jgi:pyruvate dehydrogenase E1 component alpha subunit